MTPIDGMQFLLCREDDITKPCCRNLAYYRNEKLWCVDCKRPRGRLPPKAIAAMLVLLNTYPDIMSQTHVLRDKTELPDGEKKEATDTRAGDTSISGAPLEHGGQTEVC